MDIICVIPTLCFKGQWLSVVADQSLARRVSGQHNTGRGEWSHDFITAGKKLVTEGG